MRNQKYFRTTALGLVTALAGMNSSIVHAQSNQVDTVDEIIVTATKRDERLVDVPISMSVVNAKMLAQTGVRELKAIAEYIPNVEISQRNDWGSTITIRGVGANSRNIGFDTRVGVYVDGIYMGQSPAINQELLDLQQVEVLRGPQGTLFGKDTVAGAVNMITKKPSDVFEGSLSTDIGNYGYKEFKGIINIPLAENLAFKASISKADRDGYILNTGTGNTLGSTDKIAYRGQLRYTPNDFFELNASFDGLNADAIILNGEPVTDMLGLFPVPQDRELNTSFDPHENRSVYGGHINMEFKLDNGFKIKSMTGYRDTDAFYSNTTDYSPIDIISIEYADRFKQLSQEFQLSSPDDGALTYVTGLFLYKQDAHTQRDVILGESFFEGFIAPYVAPAFGFNPATVTQAQLAFAANFVGFGPEGSKVINSGDVETNNYAAYFNASYDFSDALNLGVGARYSIVNKDVNWLLDGRNSGVFGIGSTNVVPGSGDAPTPLINDRSDKAFSPMISLTYAITDASNVYAKYSSGFKSGGFNLDYINAGELAANNKLEFDKETVDSFEIGMKGSFMDGMLSINTAAFLSNYSDYQVNQFVDLGNGNTSIRITNAAEVTTKGLEVEATLRATDSLTLQGSIGILDASFDSFPGGGTAGSDASGKNIPGVPDFNASFGALYYHNLPSMNAELLFRADVTHKGAFYTSIDNTKTQPYGAAPGTFPFGFIEAETKINGRIGYLPNSSNFELYLWARNLTDHTQVIDDLRDFFNTKVRYPSRGRTWGVEGVWNF